jgi:RNA polymerase sigma-70 factor, ECF subfamily
VLALDALSRTGRPRVLPMTDAGLVEGLRRGDGDAVRRLYREFGRLVHAVAYGVLGERHLAEEATQQTFVRAWEHASTFDQERELAPWLCVIAKRVAIDIWRREERRRHTSLDEVATIPDPAGAQQVEDVWAIRAAMSSIDPDARRLLELQYRDGFSQNEVADQLGIPVGTVKSRTHTAQTRLAAALRRHDADPRHRLQRGER